MKNRVIININNVEYSILTDKSNEYVQTIAKKLNNDLASIGKNIPLTQAYVMISFNYIDKYYEHLEKSDNLCTQMNVYIKENERLKQKSLEISKNNDINLDIQNEFNILNSNFLKQADKLLKTESELALEQIKCQQAEIKALELTEKIALLEAEISKQQLEIKDLEEVIG